MSEELDGFAADRVLGAAFTVWGRYFGLFVVLGLIVFAPAILAALLDAGSGYDPPPPLLLLLLMEGPFKAAVVYAVMRDRAGERVSLGGCLRVARRRIGRVVGTWLIVVFAVALAGVPWFLVSVVAGPWAGAPLLILPVAVYVAFAGAVPAAALEPSCASVPKALDRSLDLTRGRRLGVFVVFLVLGLFLAGVQWLLASTLGRGAAALHFAALCLLVPLPAVTLGAIYHELARTFVRSEGAE